MVAGLKGGWSIIGDGSENCHPPAQKGCPVIRAESLLTTLLKIPALKEMVLGRKEFNQPNQNRLPNLPSALSWSSIASARETPEAVLWMTLTQTHWFPSLLW